MSRLSDGFTEAYRLQHHVSGLLYRFATHVSAWTHFEVRYMAYINCLPTPFFLSSSSPRCLFQKPWDFSAWSVPRPVFRIPKYRRQKRCSPLLHPERHIRKRRLLVYALKRTEEPSHVPRNAHRIENMTALCRLLRRATASAARKPQSKTGMWAFSRKITISCS